MTSSTRAAEQIGRVQHVPSGRLGTAGTPEPDGYVRVQWDMRYSDRGDFSRLPSGARVEDLVSLASSSPSAVSRALAKGGIRPTATRSRAGLHVKRCAYADATVVADFDREREARQALDAAAEILEAAGFVVRRQPAALTPSLLVEGRRS